MAVEPAGPPSPMTTSVLSVGRVRPTSKPKLNQIGKPGSLSPLSSPSPLSNPTSSPFASPPSKERTPKGRLAPLTNQPTATTVVPALRTGVAPSPHRPCVGLSGLKERAALRHQSSVHGSVGDLGATLRRSTLPVATNPTPSASKPDWLGATVEEKNLKSSFEKFIEEALPGATGSEGANGPCNSCVPRPSTAPIRSDSFRGIPLSLEMVRGGQANSFVETEGEGVSLLMSMAGPGSCMFGSAPGAGIGLLMQTAGCEADETNSNYTQNIEGGSLSSPNEATLENTNSSNTHGRSGFWSSFMEQQTEVEQSTANALDSLFEKRGGPPSARREARGLALEGGFSMLLECKQEAQDIMSARGRDTSGLFQSLSILSEA